MARCEECVHYKLCVDTETRHLKIILAGDKAERCKQFTPTADVVPKSGWISVDERLPENGVHCLLCCDIKRIDGTHSQYVCDGYHAERWKISASGVDDDCVTEYNEEDDEYYINEGWYEVIKNWEEYTSVAIDDTVTHWMPLPEPPKGE